MDGNIAREIDDLLRMAKDEINNVRDGVDGQEAVILIDRALSFAVRARSLFIKFG